MFILLKTLYFYFYIYILKYFIYIYIFLIYIYIPPDSPTGPLLAMAIFSRGRKAFGEKCFTWLGGKNPLIKSSLSHRTTEIRFMMCTDGPLGTDSSQAQSLRVPGAAGRPVHSLAQEVWFFFSPQRMKFSVFCPSPCLRATGP